MRHPQPPRLPRPTGVSLLGIPGILLLAGTFGGAARGSLRETLRPGVPGAVATAEVAVPGGDPVARVAVTPLGPSAPPVVGAVLEDLTAPPESSELAAEEALAALSRHVSRSSHSDALRTAFQAYFRYREANPEAVRKPYLYFVDLGLDNRTRRGYVFDMEALTLVDGPFTVAHGRGSARQRDGVPTSFSNRPGSNASSLGLYLAQETYTFRGKSGGRSYSSVGLRLQGESGSFNDRARARGIVAHGAPYVTAEAAGRSEGCPAMEPRRADRLLPLLSGGGVVFLYSPRDERWLGSDPWVAGARFAAGDAGVTVE